MTERTGVAAMRRCAWTLLLALLGIVTPAGAQMPDLRAMSGTPLPADDLPPGTVSVRVVRDEITNNVVGQDVELHGAGPTQVVKTDESGRAVFNNVPAGASVHAMTKLDGRQLESQDFRMPPTSGIKVILAGFSGGGGPAPGGAAGVPPAPSAPAVSGSVVFGGQSRFVVEVTDEGLDVYNLLDIANAAASPVTTEPLVFELPPAAQALTVLDGSSPQARVDGRRFVVSGPFAPGITTVQMAYRIEHSSGSLQFEQVLPADLATTSVVARKVGAMTFRSPQAGSAREMVSDGNTYVVASGQGLKAGERLQFEFSNLPYHSSVPRFIALGLAVFVLGYGVWLAVNGPNPQVESARRALEQKRAALLDELVTLESQQAAGKADAAKYEARRESLVSRLERVYAQLDRDLPAAPTP